MTSDPTKDQNTSARSIPCLDGLRAISVFLVLLTHHYTQGPHLFTGKIPLLEAIPVTAKTGVCLFFIISGFLITNLLIKEKEKTGQISLGNFFLRRIVRILPPFYVYLVIAAFLIDIPWTNSISKAFFASTFFFYNYSSHRTMLLAHTWSLSVEEQFYLVWPLILGTTSKRTCVVFTLLGMLLFPGLRLLKEGHAFSTDPFEALETAAMDTIMFGCLLAFAWKTPAVLRVCEKTRSGLFPAAATLLLSGLYWFCHLVPPGLTFLLPLARNALLTFLLWWCVSNPKHLVGKTLQSKPLAHFGRISYSLYLWQQPFYVLNKWWAKFPVGIIGAILCAHLSFYAIEQPLSRIRDRLRKT